MIDEKTFHFIIFHYIVSQNTYQYQEKYEKIIIFYQDKFLFFTFWQKNCTSDKQMRQFY